MDTNERLKQLMKEKSITEYRLAIDSGLSKSTIAAILHRNTTPSVHTIEAVCSALGISVSQFFAEDGSPINITEEQRLLLQRYAQLSNNQKQLIDTLLSELLKQSITIHLVMLIFLLSQHHNIAMYMSLFYLIHVHADTSYVYLHGFSNVC